MEQPDDRNLGRVSGGPINKQAFEVRQPILESAGQDKADLKMGHLKEPKAGFTATAFKEDILGEVQGVQAI